MKRLRGEMFPCRLVTLAKIAFQACSIDHSDISPFRINGSRVAPNDYLRNCVRPPNVPRSLTGISSIAVDASVASLATLVLETNRLDERRERGWLLPPTRVVEEAYWRSEIMRGAVLYGPGLIRGPAAASVRPPSPTPDVRAQKRQKHHSQSPRRCPTGCNGST